MGRYRSAALAWFALAVAGCGDQGAATETGGEILVFAAASTTDVVAEAARRFEAERGIRVVCSFDGSSRLARQIEAGAPAEVFLSADQAWMDELERRGMIQPATRRDLLGNELVLVAPAGSTLAVDLAGPAPAIRRLAIGDPAHVPAGRYARQALEHLGWWDALEPVLAPALDVRAALRLVELGAADAGIVYATDARASDKVVRLAVLPQAGHAPVRYPVALCAEAGPGAAGFVAFLGSPGMAGVFERAGFTVIAGAGAP